MAPSKSFFMFCFGTDFATKLNIPAKFVEDHGLHHRRQLSLHLKCQPEERSWVVKIKKINGIFYLADGWSKFVDDNGILEKKVLVFYIISDSTLHVSIFGHDSCSELPPSSSRRQTSKPARTTWRMVKKLKDHDFSHMRLKIPKDFVEATGIGKKREIDIEDWEGRKWAIGIEAKGSFAFRGEWKSFIKANKLVPGAILLFEFTDDAMKVVRMEGQAGEKMLRQAKRGGSLPS